MIIDRKTIEVGEVLVEVTRKDIKNLHVSVHPPDGRVRVSAPRLFDDESVRLAVASKLPWILRKRRAFIEQPRQSPREMVSGESHYFMGRKHRLRVVEVDAPPRVEIKKKNEITLCVRPGTDINKKKLVLEKWHRGYIKKHVPRFIEKWESKMGVEVSEWGVKRMKTRWGSCNIRERRVWLNLELAKKHPRLLEYVVVHEMAHLLERLHNDRFRAVMDEFMPDWRTRRDELNDSALPDEEWPKN